MKGGSQLGYAKSLEKQKLQMSYERDSGRSPIKSKSQRAKVVKLN